jgi:hypothetical protein
MAVLLAIAGYRYDVSARHYLDGYHYLYQFAAEGRVFGDCPLKPGWHTRILPPNEMRWTWVFHATEGAPVTKGLELLPGSSALNRAAREIVQAKKTYLACLQKFGAEQWVSDAPIETIDDTDLPVWMRTRSCASALGVIEASAQQSVRPWRTASRRPRRTQPSVRS